MYVVLYSELYEWWHLDPCQIAKAIPPKISANLAHSQRFFKCYLNIAVTVSYVRTCFSSISLASCFDEESTWMAVSSSRMLPSELDNTSRILSSISFSCFLFSADWEGGYRGLMIPLYRVTRGLKLHVYIKQYQRVSDLTQTYENLRFSQ